MINNVKKSLKEILQYVIVILIILNTNSIYAKLTRVNFHFNILLIIVLIAYIFIYFIYKKNLKESLLNIKNDIIKYHKLIIIYFLYLLIFIIFNNIETMNFITIFAIIFPMYVYINIKGKNIEILKKLVNVIVILAIISLLFYTFISVFNVFDMTNTVEIHWEKEIKIKSFLNIYFETQVFNGFGLNIQRNTGIFTEAPMYSLILCISLAIEKFILKRNNKILELILILTIITTFSTTGIIVMSLIYILNIIIKFMEKESINKKIKIFMIIAIVFLLIISVIVFIQRIKTSSGQTRIDDYKASYEAWKESPIIGNGYDNDEIIKSHMSNFRFSNMGLSNSLMTLLAQGGIYLFILYLFPYIYILVMSIKYKQYNIIAFELVIFALFTTTIFMYTQTMNYILALAYSYIINNKEKNKNEEINSKKLYI